MYLYHQNYKSCIHFKDFQLQYDLMTQSYAKAYSQFYSRVFFFSKYDTAYVFVFLPSQYSPSPFRLALIQLLHVQNLLALACKVRLSIMGKINTFTFSLFPSKKFALKINTTYMLNNLFCSFMVFDYFITSTQIYVFKNSILYFFKYISLVYFTLSVMLK